MPLPAPPAAQTAPALPKPLESFLEALSLIPEAFIDGRDDRMSAALARVKKQWEPLRPQLAATLPPHSLETANQRLGELGNLKPRLQAEAALEVSTLLAAPYATTRTTLLMTAERVAMLAWCRVEAEHWETLPKVDEALKPVLEGDHGRHPRTVQGIQATLEELRQTLGVKGISRSKRTLERLLDELDAMEKARE